MQQSLVLLALFLAAAPGALLPAYAQSQPATGVLQAPPRNAAPENKPTPSTNPPAPAPRSAVQQVAPNTVGSSTLGHSAPGRPPPVVQPPPNAHAQKPPAPPVPAANSSVRDRWNWSTARNHWGYRPWWSASACHPWYGGHWDYIWSDNWYQRYSYPWLPWPGYFTSDVYPGLARSIGWGLTAWGLGDLYYQLGWGDYCNPYSAAPLAIAGGGTIDYSQPLAALAARSAPATEDAARQAAADAAARVDESRAAFKRGDYLGALTLADQALAILPSDTALHEYRALVLFALGNYSDAAAVLNSVLASGPGWDWSTMLRLYDSQQSYTEHLRKLERYISANPNAADARFVLAYHYLVCGHLANAAAQFEAVVRLQPADTVAGQLLNLTRNSAKPGASSADPEFAASPSGASPRPAVTPLDPDQLLGTWWVDRGQDGGVTLEFGPQGTFTWTFAKAGKTNRLAGRYSINGKGLLVLASGDSQMIGSVVLEDAQHLRFALVGGPDGDPGMRFARKP